MFVAILLTSVALAQLNGVYALVILGKLPLEETQANYVDGRKTFQKDMLLCDEQWAAMKSGKALVDGKYRWTDGTDGYPLVSYVFQESVIQDDVQAGLDHWMEHTCIKFEETNNTDQPHLRFYVGSGCSSFVGMQYNQHGQGVSIGPGCNSLNIVAHEIGHAIGFNHEQTRSDRDDYITIVLDHIIDKDRYNFNKLPGNNHSVPYDYTSVMHYGMMGFSKNGRPTIITTKPLDLDLIGRSTVLTHRDKISANRMYDCIGKWLTSCGLSSDPCLNDGYTGADCTCICPPGTSGSNCEEVVGDYYAQMRDPQSEKISKEITITVKTPLIEGTSFVKWILPPTCQRASLTITSSNMFKGDCKLQYLIIWTDQSNLYGQKMCGADVSSGDTLTSDSGIILTLLNYVEYDISETLFKANVTFESIPDCIDYDPQEQPPALTSTNLPPLALTNQSTPTPTQPPTHNPTNPPPPEEAPIIPAPTNPLITAPVEAPIISQNVPCRRLPSHNILVLQKGESITISNPNVHFARHICGWEIKAAENGFLTISCDNFFLSGYDELKIVHCFKGENSPSRPPHGMKIKFKFRTKNTGSRFSCTVVSR